MLKRVKIQGYKSLHDIGVTLENLSVLFGPNAAGKSNFLDALQLLSRIAGSRTLKEAFDPPCRGKPLECFSVGPEGLKRILKQGSALFSIEADVELSPSTKDIEQILPESVHPFTVHVIPDPHVERWMLLDSKAFKNTFGSGCKAPDQKCQKHRYKALLLEAIRKAGTQPNLSGMESASLVVEAMDFQNAARQDCSFGRFIDALGNKFNEWAREAN